MNKAVFGGLLDSLFVLRHTTLIKQSYCSPAPGYYEAAIFQQSVLPIHRDSLRGALIRSAQTNPPEIWHVANIAQHMF